MRPGWVVLLALGLLAPTQVQAQSRSREMGMPGEAAFVEHRLTLQLSDAGDAKQSFVLNVAFNVLKSYGPDKVAIDVVAFGPGIDLLRDGNANAARIRSLVAQGVRFDACMNTVETIERETGKPYPLSPDARKVDAGVVQIMTLAEHGYTTVRP
jgi:intracellular sulfur oxidation DsrE/DsrF family protein